MEAPHDIYLRISDAARALGCCAATLRRLEARGLFTARRDFNRRRLYSQAEIERLRALMFSAPEDSQ